MIEAMLVVLSNPVAGRDEDFNAWYTNIHFRDVMKFRGAIAAQRFKYSADQVQDYPGGFVAKYLALYETHDAQRFTQEHMENTFTPRMIISDAFDGSRLDDFYYYPLQFRDNAPRTGASGSVVLEQISVAAEQRSAFEKWYNKEYMPTVLDRDGVLNGAFLSYDIYGQLFTHVAPLHSHVAVYRLGDDAARAGWKRSSQLRDCPFIERDALAVTCWDILTPRVTADSVRHTTAVALDNEERARARIGDRIIRPQPV